jgi:hypothetical protein
MAGGRSFGGKRELLARGLLWSGASFLLSQFHGQLLALIASHRVGLAGLNRGSKRLKTWGSAVLETKSAI